MTTATMNGREVKTVREIALEEPSSIRVFEAFGIDYCCGGRKPLAEACAAQNVDMEDVITALYEAVKGPVVDYVDWNARPLESLVEHIVTTHHAYVKRELPRLAVLAEKVVNRHGDTQEHLPKIRTALGELDAELTSHLMKEEVVLFPYIVGMAREMRGEAEKPRTCFGTVASPIEMMMAEHDGAGLLLAEIRKLSGEFTPPVGACPTYCGFYQGLKEFEKDLHQHIHLENNILFPRAILMETESLSRKY